MPRSLVSRAVRNALLSAGIAGAGLHGAAAFAQQPAGEPAGQRQIDEVIVTGTRIRSPGLVSTSPISSVDQVEVDLRQPITVEQFIRELPAAIPSLGPGTNNGAIGGALINLRGLGSNRNLVLVNDRRITPFNLDAEVNTDNIPVALIERVDLVTGGASAVYGADAVTGVFNFVLRDDFEGIDFSTTYGTSNDGDGDRFRADLTVGANTADGRGNVTMSIGYSETDAVRQGDRGFGQFSLNSETGDPGGSSAGSPVFSVVSLDGGTPELAQLDPASGAFIPAADGELYNFNPLNLYQAPLERTQFTALGRYEIAPFAEVYGELFFTDSTVETNLASSATFFNVFDIPIGNPFIPDAVRQQLCATHDIAAENCVEGDPTTFTGSMRRRFTEFGPRINDFDNTFYQYNIGLRGDITANWRYDVSWSFGEAKQQQTRIQWGSLSATREALTLECFEDDDCVPLNLWGEDGSITQEMLDFIDLNAILNEEVKQEVGQASLSGDLGGLRSPLASDSPIGIAIGVEHRRISALTQSDSASQIDSEVLGTGAARPDRTGTLKLNEIYAEALVPLVTGRPGIRSLTLEAGLRHTDFEAERSEDYRSWKLGMAWEPTDDLRVRTMLQRATRAPNINELFAPQTTGLSTLSTDPCQGQIPDPNDVGVEGTLANLCVLTGAPEGAIGGIPSPAASQINNLSGGNPELGPEIGNTFTFGFVWQPSQVDGLTLTADYYRIRVTDAIESPSTTDVLEQCFDPAFNPNFEFNAACEQVRRSPTTGDLNAGDADGVITVDSNAGFLRTDGIDVGVQYGFDLPDPSFGRLDFNLNLTRVLSFEEQTEPDALRRDCLGFYSVPCENNVTRWKGNLRTTWSLADYTVSLNYRHLGSLRVEPVSGDFIEEFSSISAYHYFDLTAMWQATDNVRATLTVNNLFDRSPPIVGNDVGTTAANSGNTFPQWYDTIGRFYTLGVNVTF